MCYSGQAWQTKSAVGSQNRKESGKEGKRGNKDLQMSLLEWRNTPDSNGLSPVQKLMS